MRTERLTQTKIVEKMLLTKGSITSIEAIEQHRILRLSSIIHKLKHKLGYGDKIQMERILFKNSVTGNRGQCARYKYLPFIK